MKTFLPLALASLVLFTACSKTPVESAQEPVAVHSYACKSGASLLASYPSTDTATIEYQGARHELQIAVSASGARYVGKGFEWWTKGSGAGSEGTLFQQLPDGTTGAIIESCTAS